jgi:hypothetical protein
MVAGQEMKAARGPGAAPHAVVRCRIGIVTLLGAVGAMVLCGFCPMQPIALDTVAGRAELRVGESQPEIVHFNLSGPDWERIPEGYSGLAPMKLVAELNIPKQYVDAFQPLAQDVTNVALTVLYPSMRGVPSSGESSESQIGIIISAGKEETFRKGTRLIIFSDGLVRNPSLDVSGLCGYVDKVHPGYAGDELYTSCEGSEQSFSIVCYPLFNGRRPCTDTAFLGAPLGAQLFYQRSLLKDRNPMVGSLRNLILSFCVRGTERKTCNA